VAYVDDLVIAMKDPQEFINILETVHGFKRKGTGPISVHLGKDLFRDDDNTPCISPVKYIEKLVKTNEQRFGEPPKHPPYKKERTRSWILQSCWTLKELRCINLWLVHYNVL
jgi:hypothetical protein